MAYQKAFNCIKKEDYDNSSLLLKDISNETIPKEEFKRFILSVFDSDGVLQKKEQTTNTNKIVINGDGTTTVTTINGFNGLSSDNEISINGIVYQKFDYIKFTQYICQNFKSMCGMTQDEIAQLTFYILKKSPESLKVLMEHDENIIVKLKDKHLINIKKFIQSQINLQEFKLVGEIIKLFPELENDAFYDKIAQAIYFKLNSNNYNDVEDIVKALPKIKRQIDMNKIKMNVMMNLNRNNHMYVEQTLKIFPDVRSEITMDEIKMNVMMNLKRNNHTYVEHTLKI